MVTCMQTILESICTVLDVNINIFFWPSCKILCHRDVSINAAYLTQLLQTMMGYITQVLQERTKKIAVYSNRVSTVNVVHKTIGKNLDKEGTDSN